MDETTKALQLCCTIPFNFTSSARVCTASQKTTKDKHNSTNEIMHHIDNKMPRKSKKINFTMTLPSGFGPNGEKFEREAF